MSNTTLLLTAAGWMLAAVYLAVQLSWARDKIRTLRDGQAQWRKAAERDLQEIQLLTHELAEANRRIRMLASRDSIIAQDQSAAAVIA